VDGNGSANPDAVTQPLLVDTSVPDPAPVEPAAVTDPAAPPVTPADNKTTPEWAQKRINDLTARRYEAERLAEAAEAKAKNAEARAAALLEQIAKTPAATTPAAAPAPAPVPLAEDEIEKRALVKAQAIAQANKFNETCNTIVDTGKKEYKDWDDAVKNLTMVGAIGDPTKVSPEFLETVVELKNPHQILHHLGMNPEEAAKIAGMAPKKMALELARVEASLLNKPVEKTPVSGAPAPVIPINGKGAVGAVALDDPNTSAEDWYALRAKQIEERKGRYRRN
jgi:hypothetical protein